jgi:aminoglycoside phosphotransferase (APT) family kinase protein
VADHERYRLLLHRDLPDFRIDSFVPVTQGWDSAAFEVNGEWIFRFPRRPQVEARLRKEVALLPELASSLPVPVPRPEIVVQNDTFFVGHRKLDGRPLQTAARGPAEQLGDFLGALHAFPVARAARLSVPVRDADGAIADTRRFADECERLVVPLLDEEERAIAAAMFEDFFVLTSARAFETVLIHADLGPEHILCRDDEISGVIDWSDSRVGDPALDFAWLLYGLDAAFAEALLRRYGRSRPIDESLGERALFYHRLGPWHEVLYGLELAGPAYVESGLAAIRSRLRSRKYDRSP